MLLLSATGVVYTQVGAANLRTPGTNTGFTTWTGKGNTWTHPEETTGISLSVSSVDGSSYKPYNCLLTSENVLSSNSDDESIWNMPEGVYISVIVILSCELIMAIMTNALLIVTICYSPSLKTPPNAQLVSICINNLLLALCMLLSGVTLLSANGQSYCQDIVSHTIGHVQLFLTVTCLLQYWCIFSSIGFYRSKTIKKPSMSLRTRRRIIRSSIWIGWLTSCSLSLILTLTHREILTAVSWNPFKGKVHMEDLDFLQSPNIQQSSIMVVILIGFFIGIAVIILSYHKIFKTLHVARPIGRNRVSPWAIQPSLSSDDNDLTFGGRRSYRPTETTWSKSPFMISNGNTINENTTVHYQKRHQSLTFDVFALENPLRAHSIKTQGHLQLQATLSTTSNMSGHSTFMDFTDITPTGELQRLQKVKNHFALRSQSLRHDRVSLSAATKNSLVMLATYFTLSFPMVICSLPNVLSTNTIGEMSIPLLFCRLAFYLNAPAYPIWYLVFSRRVRQCLHRLREHVLIKLNIRK